MTRGAGRRAAWLLAALAAAGAPVPGPAADRDPARPPPARDAARASCEELRQRFYSLLEAPETKACKVASDCTCVSRPDVSGAGLLVVSTAASRRLNALAARYVRKGCEVSSRSGPLRPCRPTCQGGTCRAPSR